MGRNLPIKICLMRPANWDLPIDSCLLHSVFPILTLLVVVISVLCYGALLAVGQPPQLSAVLPPPLFLSVLLLLLQVPPQKQRVPACGTATLHLYSIHHKLVGGGGGGGGGGKVGGVRQ